MADSYVDRFAESVVRLQGQCSRSPGKSASMYSTTAVRGGVVHDQDLEIPASLFMPVIRGRAP